jgi:hypothetical protein
MVMILLDKLLIEAIGCAKTVFSLGMVSARLTAVRNRANGGTERRIWCTKAVLQLGTLG